MTAALLALVLSAADCERCHARQATDFAGSRHAHARRLEIFALSYAAAQTRWCLSCHQPEGDGDGHTCMTCHRVDGAAGSVRSTAASAEGVTAHPVTEEPGFETSACIGCHEFTVPLPGQPVVLSKEPLQSTVSEVRDAMPGASCVTCHEPHRAPGGHDVELVRKAVSVSASPVDGGVVFEVRVGRTGHRFPTGDPFRRLVVVTCNDVKCADVAGRRVFARSIGSLDGGAWKTVRDDTLPSGGRARFTLPEGRYWRATYLYGDPRFEPSLPPEEVSVELGSGAISP